ncbi:unnamed protein product [Schistosoma curassoni]|uniref:Ovule protein n=1 Tax=Schistosoma curassoni TaxID=6186 RepID=A0A183JQY4_9TREM|nr:unnamed protein product [Schistosoma curassoni]
MTRVVVQKTTDLISIGLLRHHICSSSDGTPQCPFCLGFLLNCLNTSGQSLVFAFTKDQTDTSGKMRYKLSVA